MYIYNLIDAIRFHIRTVNLPGFRALNTDQQSAVRRRIASAAARAAREGRYEEYRRRPNSTNQPASGTRAGSRRAGGVNGPRFENPFGFIHDVLAANAGVPQFGSDPRLSASVRRRHELVQHLRQRLHHLGVMAREIMPHDLMVAVGLGDMTGPGQGRSATKQQISELPKCTVGEDEDLGAWWGWGRHCSGRQCFVIIVRKCDKTHPVCLRCLFRHCV